jgi:hypothetical protein
MRSLVRGDRSVRRYQVTTRITREQALAALSGFFGNIAVARDARTKSRVTESFLVHLPFWTLWSRALGWAFGQKRDGSGKHRHYEPREVRLASDMVWSGAACDVAEFGVASVTLTNQTLEPFSGEHLHATGMVFEPVGSVAEAEEAAQASFDAAARGSAGLDRLNQLFMRFVNRRFGLVYYPLWALRYTYRNRSFQVVVDGFTVGPYGSARLTLYRAGALSWAWHFAFLVVAYRPAVHGPTATTPSCVVVASPPGRGRLRLLYGEQWSQQANLRHLSRALAGDPTLRVHHRAWSSSNDRAPKTGRARLVSAPTARRNRVGLRPVRPGRTAR